VALGPLTAAVQDKDAGVRGRAAEALGEYGEPAASNALAILLKDSDPVVRSQAAAALQTSSVKKSK
jgi:HEAT repeat protein